MLVSIAINDVYIVLGHPISFVPYYPIKIARKIGPKHAYEINFRWFDRTIRRPYRKFKQKSNQI